VKASVTFERLGLKILARSERFGTTREYEAIRQPDGRYHILRWEDGRQEVAMIRNSEAEAISSLDEVVESLVEFAGSRI
jgi:hypothetical protein